MEIKECTAMLINTSTTTIAAQRKLSDKA